ncbi:MAG: hypothetical protein RL059_1019 [Bacteroidota bacterium]|jgi:putative endonuclease
MTNEELGQWGEETACNLLVSKGYKIVARNFRFKKHEIDIVLSKNDSLIIAEVKTRQTAEIGEPWKAVTRNKQRQIIKVANYYVQSQDREIDVRFDVVSIVHNQYHTKIIHIEDAFSPIA